MASWRDGLTDEEIRDAEMKRGNEVTCEKHGAAHEALRQRFDPDYVAPKRTDYNIRLAEQNKDRWK